MDIQNPIEPSPSPYKLYMLAVLLVTQAIHVLNVGTFHDKGS